MSKYTTEVRYICEQAYGLDESKGADNVDTIISGCLDKVFNFSFPIFDENYRRVLEAKILKHYYTREIACETVGLWKLKLNTKLNEIMPYYNQLYKSELLEFNPIYTHELDKEHKGELHSNASGESNNSSDTVSEAHGTNNNVNWDVYSDTPQGGLQNVENLSYLTNARRNTDEGGSDSTGKGHSESKGVSSDKNDTNDYYFDSVKGREGVSGSKLLKEFRETFLNIDMLVIEELEELFFQLW